MHNVHMINRWIVMVTKQLKNLSNFLPGDNRLLVNDWHDPNTTPLDKRDWLGIMDDDDRPSKKGVYACIYSPELGARMFDWGDDFHDKIRATWNALVSCKITCTSELVVHRLAMCE